MTTYQIVGLCLAGFALGNYIRLVFGLITAREHRPKVDHGLILKSAFPGAIGAAMYAWPMVPWWGAVLVYCSVPLVMMIPLLILRAR